MNDPVLYQECNEIPKRDALACLTKRIPSLKWKSNNNRVIDLGCGDGSVTSILKEFLPADYKLLGCDISENMISFASNNHSNKQTSFIVLDIVGDLPEDMKGAFDHVFSFYALNWIADQKRAFENVFDLLNQDGESLMTLAAYFPFYDVYRILSKNSKWSTWIHSVENHISPYHDSEEPDLVIMKLMKDIGFINIDVECKDMEFVYRDKEILRKHTTAVNPFKIPEHKYDEFIEEYIGILKDLEINHKGNTNSSSKEVTIYYKLVTAYGRKPLASEIKRR